MLNYHQKQHEYKLIERNVPQPQPAAITAVTVNPTTLNISKYLKPSSTLWLNCDLCGYKFDSIYKLIEHKKLHMNDSNLKRPFKCHLCQVTFAKVDQLSRHMIIHQGSELDHVCVICYSTFSRKQDLDRHMNFHSTK